MVKTTRRQIELAAAAIANARAGRRGMPPLSNVLELIASVGDWRLLAEVREDAAAALEAVAAADPFACERQIAAALTDEWQTVSEVCDALGTFQEVHVGRALDYLAATGRAECVRDGVRGSRYARRENPGGVTEA